MKQAPVKEQKSSNKQTLQQHHENAAEHHKQASRHHKEAGKCCESKDLKTAAHHTQIAQGHTVQAMEQGAEISKKYANKHSSLKQSGPVIERPVSR